MRRTCEAPRTRAADAGSEGHDAIMGVNFRAQREGQRRREAVGHCWVLVTLFFFVSGQN